MAKRRENDDERCVQNWLGQQGHTAIRRPCSDPPDFVVDRDCAVEVTRLNQRIVVGDDDCSKGEEQARIPLTDSIEEIVCELGQPGNKGRSWVIDCEYDFREPLPSRKIITAQVSDAFAPLLKPHDSRVVSGMHTTHLDCSKHAGEISYLRYPHLCLACGICLELAEISHDPARFIVQNVSDGKGIAVAEELEKVSETELATSQEKSVIRTRSGRTRIGG